MESGRESKGQRLVDKQGRGAQAKMEETFSMERHMPRDRSHLCLNTGDPQANSMRRQSSQNAETQMPWNQQPKLNANRKSQELANVATH
jgi:hypothetical protein